MSFLNVRGIKLPDKKKETRNVPLIEIRPQVRYDVALVVGKHNECEPIVKVGDSVAEAAVIAKPVDRLSPFIFSPVSGIVRDIVVKNNSLGFPCKHIVIEADKENRKVMLENIEDLTKENVFKRIVESGMVDNFGKKLPSFVKYINANGKAIKKIVINATEIDPYLTCGEMIAKNYRNDIFEGAKLLALVAGTTNIEFVVTYKQVELCEILKKEISARKKNNNAYKFKIRKIEPIYPFKHDRLITYYMTGKKLLAGSPPSDAGLIIESFQNCYDISKAVYENMPVISRIITVAGNNIIRKANYIVRNGTSFRHILEVVGTINPGEAFKIIEGSVMTGIAQDNIDISVGLSTKSIIFLSRDEFLRENEKACVNCGQCVKHCPVRINPKEIDKACIEGDKIKALKCGALACIDCGVCSYVCPSKRYLAQRIDSMQNEIRKGGKE